MSSPLPPAPGEVVTGILAVLAGALTASVFAFLGRRTHNWLHYIGALGGVLVVAGVVGQRATADPAGFGAWNAGIEVPLLQLHVDVVTAIGVFIALLGVTLTLVFERVPHEDEIRRPLVHRALEDDDAV